MKIAVDIDDTLNIVDRAGRAGAYIARNRLPFRMVDPHAQTLLRMFDWQEGDVARFLESGGITAFLEAEARPHARAVLESWQTAGDEIVILTSRPNKWFGNAVNLSRDWLEKRRIPCNEIVAEVENKGEYCVQHGISVLVDNDLSHCLGAQALGVYAVLAVSRDTLARAHEVHYGGENWVQIDGAVRHIRALLQGKDGAQ